MEKMIGKIILNYKIVEKIGEGGMGSVYKGRHIMIEGQEVGIKMIRAGKVNEFTRTLLKNEAEHLASLHHQNVAGFINYTQDQEGNLYLVMEYAQGHSLKDYIEKVNGLIIEKRAVPMMEKILDGVGAAHKKGIIHRDIKPQNIIISDEGEPKLIDFGIAGVLRRDQKRPDSTSGLQMGTPAYMSPEVVKGGEADERSDIYALGVVLYEMLTGHPLYDTAHLTAFEIEEKIVDEPLPRLKASYKYTSDEIQKIVDKATAKAPEDRYQTCEEMKRDLEKMVAPPTPGWKKAALGLGVAAVVLLGAVGLWSRRTHVEYYKDYVEQWGVPHGIGKVGKRVQRHRQETWEFTYKGKKLVQLRLVNGKGNLTETEWSELERGERGIDQRFVYTEKGNIDKVTIRDFGGRVVYVKDYNESMGEIVFRWDNAAGTEKVLPNKMLGNGDMMDDFSNDKGTISRHEVTYDKNGFVTEIRYAASGISAKPTRDADGIWGRAYERDPQGRILSIRYVGADGTPTATPWGLSRVSGTWDEENNLVKMACYDLKGRPAELVDENGSGDKTIAWTYDKYGNVVTEKGFYGYRGKQWWQTEKQYDKNGNCIRERKIWEDDEDDEYNMEWEYDERGYCLVEKAKEEGIVTEWKLDEKGLITGEWYKDENGELKASDEGYAGKKFSRDDEGQITEIRYFGEDGRPVMLEAGYAGLRFELNERKENAKIISLDENGEMINDQDGVASEVYRYDERGCVIEQMNYDKNGKLVDGDRYEYDENGNKVKWYWIWKNGDVERQNGEVAWVEYKYDEGGWLVEETYRDYKGRKVNIKLDKDKNVVGAGYRYVRDPYGKILNTIVVKADVRVASAESNGGGNAPVWVNKLAQINRTLPLKYGYENGNLVMEKCRVVGTGYNRVEIRFGIPYTAAELGADKMKKVKALVDQHTRKVNVQLGAKNVYVEGKLYDKNGRVVYKIGY